MRVFFWKNYMQHPVSGELDRDVYRICALREDGLCLWNDLTPITRTTRREGVTQSDCDFMDAEERLQAMRLPEHALQAFALEVTATEWIENGARTHIDFQAAYQRHLTERSSDWKARNGLR